ncbi:serine hydrolase [Lysinibacillus agricola]|uniref:Serine hydrolase n=1 Tax=Lysinibacillus agricola TaxID=2590012 RepID=A0ABX7AL57_9BACI|nr:MULTISPECIES: serine hydrolase [Lysinibacillus]KOS59815.1 hypothetical protein AN161_26195 [Lysinibacillus sp. FJAT-14222]QQP10590.1 serine hydrolase [Lysinibacillus agricola]
MDKVLQTRLEKLVHDTKEQYGLPSLTVSVSKGSDEFHYSIGAADLEEENKATVNTVYCIGSSTKAFIALSLCILSEKGKIDLDMPVKTYLPNFEMYDEYSTEHLTIRDALSHRSGLPRHDTSWLNTPERTTKEQVETLAFLPPAWPLRYRFHYQNHMFMVATLLVEKVGGIPWGDFVKENILLPLGMNSTYIYGDLIRDDDSRKARPYINSGGQIYRIPYNYAKTSGGAGTMYSSTVDMLKWLKFQLNGNGQVLGKEMLQEMHSPQIIIRDGDIFNIMFPEIQFTSYGLAWFIESYRGQKIVHHGGTLDGFKSQQIFVPEKDIAISILCNLNQTTAVTSIGYAILDELMGFEPLDWMNRYIDASAKLSAEKIEETRDALKNANNMKSKCENRDSYIGTYSNRAYGKAIVLENDGQIYLQMIGLTLPIIPTGKDKFHLAVESYGICFPVTFKRDETGKVTKLLIPLEESLKEAIPFYAED